MGGSAFLTFLIWPLKSGLLAIINISKIVICQSSHMDKRVFQPNGIELLVFSMGVENIIHLWSEYQKFKQSKENPLRKAPF